MDKRSSLLQKFVTYRRKKFYNIDTWSLRTAKEPRRLVALDARLLPDSRTRVNKNIGAATFLQLALCQCEQKQN